MKGLVFNGDFISYAENLPLPIRGRLESLIKIQHAAICSTDREIIKGYKGFRGILGHEFVGLVVESEAADLIDQRVVGELNQGCGKCEYCQKGLEKHCLSRSALGIIGKDGCFAEYISLPNRLLHRVPSDMPNETAIFTEPMAAAINAVSQSAVTKDECALILGDGRLAYMIYLALIGHTADISVLGRSQKKLDTFADYASPLYKTDRQYDVVFEATGSSKGIIEALNYVKAGGKIILKSTTAQDTRLNLSRIVINEITLIGSRCGSFKAAFELLATPLSALPKIELYSLSEYEQAFKSTAFKVGFKI